MKAEKRYTIRPLKWEGEVTDEVLSSVMALTPFVCYTVRRAESGGLELHWCLDGDNEDWRDVPSVEEGKRLAWEDWLKRLLLALQECD